MFLIAFRSTSISKINYLQVNGDFQSIMPSILHRIHKQFYMNRYHYEVMVLQRGQSILEKKSCSTIVCRTRFLYTKSTEFFVSIHYVSHLGNYTILNQTIFLFQSGDSTIFLLISLLLQKFHSEWYEGASKDQVRGEVMHS